STEDPAPPSSTEAPAPPPSTEAPASPSPTEAPVPPSPTEAPAASSPTPSASKEGSSRVTGYAQATLSSGPAYETMVIYHHNAARALHGAEPLVWNNDLAAKSLDWANNCQFKHNSAGQNLFATSGDAFNVSAGIINSWYNAEIVHMDGYWGAPNIPEPAFSSVGHFTQMVWKSTKSIGCASVDCSGRMVDENGNPIQYSKYTVCDYDPAGNVVGQYAENIVRPSTATVLNWAA
ncbi:PR-1-like protein, partial [Delitschia confertaspora ATCC 74209]